MNGRFLFMNRNYFIHMFFLFIDRNYFIHILFMDGYIPIYKQEYKRLGKSHL